jgi:hypothetical protein
VGIEAARAYTGAASSPKGNSMKITAIEVLRLIRPAPSPHPAKRRPGYLETTPHAFPINRYPEFSRIVSQFPAVIQPEFWVRVTVEDGTWGVGQGHWGDVCAVIVRNHS